MNIREIAKAAQLMVSSSGLLRKGVPELRVIDKGALTTTQFTIVEVRTDLELNQCVCRVVPTRYDQKENVKVLADEKDPNLENVFLRRGIYYDEGSVINETT